MLRESCIPEYTKGEKRRWNPEYRRNADLKEAAKKRNDRKAYKVYDRKMRVLPTQDPQDPDYRRLRYVRYADDFLLSFVGTKEEAEEIKLKLTEFLRNELKLELSEAKTLVTHAQTESARFLSYQIHTQQCDTWRDTNGSCNVNAAIALKVPDDVLQRLCSQYLRNGKPIHRGELIMNSDFDIVARYQSEYRGYVQYYLLAQNVSEMNRLKWIMETSLLKTLANKYKSTVTKMAKRYGASIRTECGTTHGLRVVIERPEKKPLIAEFGGIPLRSQNRVANITDGVVRLGQGRNQLIQRLLADQCEMCGDQGSVQVHHIHKLADLTKPGRTEKPFWIQRMAAIRRKTLVVCKDCHDAIHTGNVRAKWASSLE